jgi:hypothetical protein
MPPIPLLLRQLAVWRVVLLVSDLFSTTGHASVSKSNCSQTRQQLILNPASLRRCWDCVACRWSWPYWDGIPDRTRPQPILIDPKSGLAPPTWQDGLGETIALRADGKPFTSTHFYAAWDFFNVVLDAYGDYSPKKVAKMYFSPSAFREFHESQSPAVLEW